MKLEVKKFFNFLCCIFKNFYDLIFEEEKECEQFDSSSFGNWNYWNNI